MATFRRAEMGVRGLTGALGRSERTFLRYPEPSDEDAFLALLAESRDFHRPWMPVAPRGRELHPDRFLAFLERSRTPREERFLLCRAEDGAPVGTFSISEIVRGVFQCGVLGYWIGRSHAGRGYMREGLPLLLDHSFGSLGLHRLEANIQPANAPSIALVRGAGFRFEGVGVKLLQIAGRWRDHERWAILAEEWEARRGKARRKRG